MAQKPSKGKKSIVAKNADVTRINADGGLVEHHEARITIGPLPPPDVLKKYEEAEPGTAKIIVGEFQKNSQHYRERKLPLWLALVAFVGVAVSAIAFPENPYLPLAMTVSFGLFLNFLHKN